MQWHAISRVVGACLMVLSLAMLTPVLIAYLYLEAHVLVFWQASLLTALLGGVFLWYGGVQRADLRLDDGFMLIALIWSILSLCAALPFILHPEVDLPIIDALFEAVSGFTTTGASVIDSVDGLPKSVLYYRQQLHFLGGMGILLMAVAVLPTLGIGGLSAYQAELPGPFKESKIAPRVKEAASMLWQIYVLLTIGCAMCYLACGMHWLDALGESFSTVATGGFSMHDRSFAHYTQPGVHGVAMIFMLLSASNYALHYTLVHKGSWQHYPQDEEWRYFMVWVLMAIGLAVWMSQHHQGAIPISEVMFTVISLATTTGLMVNDFAAWPGTLPCFLMLVATIGSCSGSTSGGLKILRCLLIKKQIQSELNRVVHPQAVLPIKFTGLHLTSDVVQSMWAFLAAFVSMMVLLTFGLMWGGLDLESALGTAVAALANAGAGMGRISYHYGAMSDVNKVWCIAAMVVGRLEIFTVWVILCPTFWRR